jgi:hypothetical protein
LKLLDREADSSEAHDESGDEAPTRHDKIEYIPAIGAETLPAETKEAHNDIDDIYQGADQEEIVYARQVNTASPERRDGTDSVFDRQRLV